jgi:hypothetical protein
MAEGRQQLERCDADLRKHGIDKTWHEKPKSHVSFH